MKIGIGLALLLLAQVSIHAQETLPPTCCESCVSQFWNELDLKSPTCCLTHRQEYWESMREVIPMCCQEHKAMHQTQLNRRLGGVESSGVASQSLPFRQTFAPGSGADPFGFGGFMNQTRARFGLSPLRYNPSMDSVAVENNRQQRRNGRCGHFYLGGMAQNSADGYKDNSSLLQGWMNSPGHRALLLNREKSEYGFHFDGNYSTLVVR